MRPHEAVAEREKTMMAATDAGAARKPTVCGIGVGHHTLRCDQAIRERIRRGDAVDRLRCKRGRQIVERRRRVHVPTDIALGIDPFANQKRRQEIHRRSVESIGRDRRTLEIAERPQADVFRRDDAQAAAVKTGCDAKTGATREWAEKRR